MRLLVYIALVAASRPCALTGSASNAPAFPWQSLCACAPRLIQDTPTQDNAGIYYAPVYPIPVLSIINQPLYVLNPADISEIQNPIQTINDNNTQKTKRGNTRDRIKDLKKDNIYLDISVDDLMKLDYDFQLTERFLSECTDLRILLDYRTLDKISTLQKIWGDAKFDKYKSLTDPELSMEIENKCSHPKYILEKSLQEIKDARPVKDSYIFNENEFAALPINTNKFSNDTDKKKTHLETSTQLDLIYAIDDISTTVSPRNNIQSDLKSQSRPDIGQPQIVSLVTNKSYINKKEHISKVTHSYNLTDLILNDHNIKNNENKTNLYANGTNYLSENITNESNSVSVDLHNDLFQKIQPIPNNDYRIEHTTTENSIKDSESKEIPISINPKVEAQTSREQYHESEIKIPRVITHEFSNDTLSSMVDGTEKLPNNDFKDNINEPDEIIITTNNSIPGETEMISDKNLNDISDTEEKQIKNDLINTSVPKQNENTGHKITNNMLGTINYSKSQNNNKPGKEDVNAEEDATENIWSNYTTIIFNSDTSREVNVSNGGRNEEFHKSNEFLTKNVSLSAIKKGFALEDTLSGTERSAGIENTASITEEDLETWLPLHKSDFEYLSGRLYFLFKNNKIPAHFVQESNGNIALGLDGQSLCNKLLQTDSKPLLLSLMCNETKIPL